MNLQLKADFASKCFEIFSKGEDVSIIIDQIEELMSEHGLTYTNQNRIETVTTPQGKTYTVTARDRFEAALDTDILNAQHMKTILEGHINFLYAFILKSKAA
jgi:hypothetical protein